MKETMVTVVVVTLVAGVVVGIWRVLGWLGDRGGVRAIADSVRRSLGVERRVPLTPPKMTRRAVSACLSEVGVGINGRCIVGPVFEVDMNPRDAAALAGARSWVEEAVAKALEAEAKRRGWDRAAPVQVRFVVDDCRLVGAPRARILWPHEGWQIVTAADDVSTRRATRSGNTTAACGGSASKKADGPALPVVWADPRTTWEDHETAWADYETVGAVPVEFTMNGRDELVFFVGREPLTAGRSAGCDITIKSENVSRRHARFRIVGGELQVTDDGSTNGTMVIEPRGRRTVPTGTWVGVPAGASVGFGSTVVSVQVFARAQEQAK